MPLVALESLTFGATLLSNSFKKLRNSDQGCPSGCQHRSKGVPPRGSEKMVAKQTRHSRKVSSYLLQNGSQHVNVDVFGMIFFKVFQNHVLDCFLMHCSIISGLTLASFM